MHNVEMYVDPLKAACYCFNYAQARTHNNQKVPFVYEWVINEWRMRDELSMAD